jgi:hypothetical protein
MRVVFRLNFDFGKSAPEAGFSPPACQSWRTP